MNHDTQPIADLMDKSINALKKTLTMKKEKHIDGNWYTTEYKYKGRRILIKSGEGKGIKAHVFLENSDKVQFTLRYSFIKPEDLIKKVKAKIDNQQEKTKIYIEESHTEPVEGDSWAFNDGVFHYKNGTWIFPKAN